ncbi:Lrp/AsnC family transcriptional regulator [Zhouia spongiae]|uniref:Lrp/AsnC family transcriptional regulator n=1 Tax=Zhouia spongiae TaxID=2202721 RepID=A0ABY3YRV7_9FLAO|nr:Lrp/AsnC family transcriptional regulator [Zhouia spongiae]UNZ00270.1 Lrp/AsnC family transcriptional regulator [Zhouia spongiae]
MRPLDDYDKKILRFLQQNNRITTEELSNKINLSQSAIQRRITKLRNDNIIEADISIISPKAIGIGVTCVIDVILYEGNSRAIDEFKIAMTKCPEVTQCYYVTGTYDFVLITQTRDMQHFEEFQKTHLMDNKHLKHFYTHVIMDKVKINYGITI